MRLLETGALAAVLTMAVACTSTGQTEITRTVAGFKGQPREAAIARLGRPNKVIIEKGATESYWLKVDVETYAGLSNRREYRTVDGAGAGLADRGHENQATSPRLHHQDHRGRGFHHHHERDHRRSGKLRDCPGASGSLTAAVEIAADLQMTAVFSEA